MANRAAFIDFAQGLLNLNPLERWTPNQAKLHPFITQAKFTGPFVPPMTLRTGSNKSPAPGVQEQQRAEAMSKQRQQAQQQNLVEWIDDFPGLATVRHILEIFQKTVVSAKAAKAGVGCRRLG